MKKLMKIGLIIVIIFIILIIGFFFFSMFVIQYDCPSFNFYKIHESSGENLGENLNELIENNKEELNKEDFENCTVKSYTKNENSDIKGILKKYSFEEYNVSFSCESLTFGTKIFVRNNDLYSLAHGLGPCSKENVRFEETARFRIFEDDW